MNLNPYTRTSTAVAPVTLLCCAFLWVFYPIDGFSESRGSYENSDLNTDHVVDLADVAIFARHYLEQDVEAVDESRAQGRIQARHDEALSPVAAAAPALASGGGPAPAPGGLVGAAGAPPPPAQPTPFVRAEKKVGRNEPCPCGSGKKYKHCHGRLQ